MPSVRVGPGRWRQAVELVEGRGGRLKWRQARSGTQAVEDDGQVAAPRVVVDGADVQMDGTDHVLKQREVGGAQVGAQDAGLLCPVDERVHGGHEPLTGPGQPAAVVDLGGGDLPQAAVGRQLLGEAQWVTTAYILAATVGMPVYGKIGDLVGRKPVFVAAIGLFLVGSVVSALATDMGGLIAGRAVQGLGGGGLMIISQAIIADLVPPRQRAKYMAPMGAVFGLASVVGPLLGGWFTDAHSWRWAFWINVPLGLLAIAVTLVALRVPSRATRVRLDYPGTAFMAVAVTATVLCASWGGTRYACRTH